MTRRVRVVVIAPAIVSVTIEGPCRHEVVAFSSIPEFERWRHGTVRAPATIAPFVQKALSIVKGKQGEKTTVALGWLRSRHSVPTVKEFSGAWSSRRSFFRAWKDDMNVSPREFLHLIRSLYAENLLRRGMDEKDVANKIGVRSVASMHRAIAERHGAKTKHKQYGRSG
jgi:AraC-like DNA-binding protein